MEQKARKENWRENMKEFFPHLTDQDLICRDEKDRENLSAKTGLTRETIDMIILSGRTDILACEIPRNAFTGLRASKEDPPSRMSETYQFIDETRHHYPPTHAPEDLGYDAGIKKNHSENDGRY